MVRHQMASDFRVSFVFTPLSWMWGFFRDKTSYTWTLEAGPVVVSYTTNRGYKPHESSWAAVGTAEDGWQILGATEDV